MTFLRSKTIVIILCLLPLIPLWYFDYLPLQDFANHFARLTILRNLEHSDFYRQNFYFNSFRGISPLPYLALDIFITKIVSFLDIDKAMRLFLTLYVVLYVLGVHLLTKQLRQDLNLLLLVNMPLIYSFYFHLGFLNFIFSIPLLLFAIWLVSRYETSKRSSDILLIGLLSLLIYLSHIFTLLIFYMYLFCYFLSVRLKMKEYVFMLAAILPSLIFSLNFLMVSTKYNPLGIVAYETVKNPVYSKMVLLLVQFSYLPFGLIVVCFALYLVAVYIIARNSIFSHKSFLAVSIICLLLFFILPPKGDESYIDGYYFDVRFFLFFMILFPFSLKIKDRRITDMARVILYGLFFVSFGVLLSYFSEFNRNFSTVCADSIADRSAVFQINVIQPKSGIRPYNGAWGYFYKQREIITPYLFIGSHIPVSYRNRPPILSEIQMSNAEKIMNEPFLERLRDSYDYVILTGHDPNVEKLLDAVSHEACSDRLVSVYEIKKSIIKSEN